MSIIDDSWTDAIGKALSAVIDALRGGLNSIGQAAQPEPVLASLNALFQQLSSFVEDLSPVDPAGAFLAKEGAQPRNGQATIDEFAQLIANGLEGKWTPDLVTTFGSLGTIGASVPPPVSPTQPPAPAPTPPPTPPTLTSIIASFLKEINPILDPELYIRFALNIKESLTAEEAAQKVAQAVVTAAETAAASLSLEWPADAPLTDDEKEAEEPDIALPEALIRYVDAVVGLIPGTQKPNNPQVGRDVHRYLMGAYVGDHQTRSRVIMDGGLLLHATPGQPTRLTLSRLLSSTGQPLSSDPMLTTFAKVMRDPNTQRRIHPDIADLDDAAYGEDPDQDWGWFEIKPMATVRRAIEETFFYYLPVWNTSVPPSTPDWKRTAGVWQPGMVFMSPTFKYFHAAVTIFPGAIGYLTYELKSDLDFVRILILSFLSSLFVQRMLTELRRLGMRYIDAEVAFAMFLAAWASILVLSIVLVLALLEALAGITVASIAAALAELAAAVRLIFLRFFPSPA